MVHNEDITIIGWTAVVGFLICIGCFWHINTLASSYHLIKSGSDSVNCTTMYYGSKWIDACQFYSIEQCPNGIYKNNIMDHAVVCVDTVLAPYLVNDLINSTHVRYYFKDQPSIYYSKNQFDAFMHKYSGNPIASVITLSVFTGIFALIAFVSLYVYCVNRNRTNKIVQLKLDIKVDDHA
jgi:hypothetical protein